jgi:hydrogenase maturation protein HypF
MWLEHQARQCATTVDPYPFPYQPFELDFRPLLGAIIRDRRRTRDPRQIARAFHAGVARGLSDAAKALAGIHGVETIVASGGVMQNEMLLDDLTTLLDAEHLTLWTNHTVPPNDGGISLGQATLAAFDQCTNCPSR